MKDQTKGQTMTVEDIIQLENQRILQKNIIYVNGLTNALNNKAILMNNEYFGHFGNVKKIAINQNPKYRETLSLIVTYSSSKEASLALLCLNNVLFKGHVLKASYFSTQYCKTLFKNFKCTNKECSFLHSLQKSEDCFAKEEITDKDFSLKCQKIAIKQTDIFNYNVKNSLLDSAKNKKKPEFPNITSFYSNQKINDKFKTEILIVNEKKSLLGNENLFSRNQKENNLGDIFKKKQEIEVKNNDENIDVNTKCIEIIRKDSDNSCSSKKTNSTELTTVLKEKAKIDPFESRNKSRFNFESQNLDETENEGNYEVTQNMNDFISMKTRTYYFFKNIDQSMFEIRVKDIINLS